MKAFRKTEKTYAVCVFCGRGFNIVDTRNLLGKRCPYCYFGKVEKIDFMIDFCMKYKKMVTGQSQDWLHKYVKK